MPNRLPAAAKILLAGLLIATAAPAVHARDASGAGYWQQIVALLARWSGHEATQNCVPSEVDSCGVDPPQ